MIPSNTPQKIYTDRLATALDSRVTSLEGGGSSGFTIIPEIESIYTKLFIKGEANIAQSYIKDFSPNVNDLYYMGGMGDAAIRTATPDYLTIPGGIAAAGTGNRGLISSIGTMDWALENEESLFIQGCIQVTSTASALTLFGTGDATHNGFAMLMAAGGAISLHIYTGVSPITDITAQSAGSSGGTMNITANTDYYFQFLITGKLDGSAANKSPYAWFWQQYGQVPGQNVAIAPYVAVPKSADTANPYKTSNPSRAFGVGFPGDDILNSAATVAAMKVKALRISVLPRGKEPRNADDLFQRFRTSPYKLLPYLADAPSENAPLRNVNQVPLMIVNGYGQSTEHGQSGNLYNPAVTTIGGILYSGSNALLVRTPCYRPKTRFTTFLHGNLELTGDYIAQRYAREVWVCKGAVNGSGAVYEWSGFLRTVAASTSSYKRNVVLRPNNGFVYRFGSFTGGVDTISINLTGTAYPTTIGGTVVVTNASSISGTILCLAVDDGSALGVKQYGQAGFDPFGYWNRVENHIVWGKARGHEVWLHTSGHQADLGNSVADTASAVTTGLNRMLTVGVDRIFVDVTFAIGGVGVGSYHNFQTAILANFVGNPKVSAGADFTTLTNHNYSFDGLHQSDKGDAACHYLRLARYRELGLIE